MCVDYSTYCVRCDTAAVDRYLYGDVSAGANTSKCLGGCPS